MTVTEHSSQGFDALRSLLDAPADSLPAVLRSIDAELRVPPAAGGRAAATELGRAAIPALAAATKDTPADRLPALVLLLGLLADSDAHDQVRAELGPVLALFDRPGADRRLVAALLFLAGLFPEDGAQVLAAADALVLSPDDRSRLERSLAERPDTPVLARVWPSPAMWAVTDEEHDNDHKRWGGRMPDEQVIAMWDGDTRALRDYSGAKAVALLDSPAADYRPERDFTAADPGGADATGSALAAVELLAPFEKLLICPDCAGRLALGPDGARCEGCETLHPATGDWLDLSSAAGLGMDALILNDVAQVLRYERGLRPGFLRVMGRDFDDRLTVEDEIRFLTERMRSVDGPTLDLAAGTGRFTHVLSELLGPERLVALDLSTSMLSVLQATAAKLPAVRASAVNLPFADASLAAVTCWNALQTLPSKDQVIAEVGRVLRPGGTFVLFTFVPDEDRLYREFQARQEQALRVRLHPREELVGWLEAAGLTVTETHGRGYLFLSAVCEALA